MKNSLAVLFIFILSVMFLIVGAAPLTQETEVCNTDVIVQTDDWLSKLADKYLGDLLLYPAIIDATNQHHELDSSYAKIDNPDLIEPGWKLCIPNISSLEHNEEVDLNSLESEQQALSDLDTQLRMVLSEASITPLDPAPKLEQAKVTLGQALYFDKLLSGDKNIACSSCHLPSEHTADGLSVSIGAGGVGIGPMRTLGESGTFIPRNAPEIFNRGSLEWTTMFWDSRVSGSSETGFNTPAADMLPTGLDNVLAAQAMFPVTSKDEMRGYTDDLNGGENELALIDDYDFTAIWDALMQRLLAIPEYVELFEVAYPEIPTNELGFEHAANAIAAFEIDAFTFVNSPWDRYVAGDNTALSEDAKQGALLFYGEAGCSSCHSGNLFTDQEHHNIATPQIGPGKGDESPLDWGRFRETNNPTDYFAFRTPPLRNVALTGPWMHDGAYTELKDVVVLPHLDPESALRNYDTKQLIPELQDTFQQDEKTLALILEYLDPASIASIAFTDEEVGQLMAFLNALTDPSAIDMSNTAPESVPSGLSIDK